MANTLTKEDISEYEEAFAMFDKNGDGIVTIQELGEYMKSIGQNPTKEELINMIHVEKDNDASTRGEEEEEGSSSTSTCIDFPQFLELMAKKKQGDQCERTIQIFKFFDKDGDGFISSAELREAIKTLGEGMVTSEQAEEMIRESDIDADGRLCYSEFVYKMFHM